MGRPSTKKSIFLGSLTILAAALSAGSARADAPTISNILPADYDSIVKEFSANFAYTTVTPASGLGGFGHFEFGLVGGESTDPYLIGLVQTANPGQNFPSHLYHAALVGRLGLPDALTAEAILFPKRTIAGVSLQQYGGAVEWTPTDGYIEDSPVNLSAKFSAEKAQVTYTQNASATVAGTSQTVPVGVQFSDIEWALQAKASFKFLVFEPYVGAGYVHSDGTLSLSTNGYNVNVFSTNFTSAAQSNSAESIPTSFQYLAGLDIRLAFFSLGVEAMHVFSESNYTARVSFRF